MPGEISASDNGGAEIVVQQPIERCGTVGFRIGGGEGLRVLPDEVVEMVTTPRTLVDQVIVVQGVETTGSGSAVGAIERGRCVGVGVGARVKAEPTEKALLVWAEVT